MDGISDGGVPPKSCTYVTVTVNKIVVVLGEECKAEMVTGSTMTTTTSKSPGNTTTTRTRMTVTINNVMPQGIETTVEREVGNNIGNNGNVGIEMREAAGEAGGMAVQSINRRRKEKERKRKYRARKLGPVDVSAKIASQQMKRPEKYRTYQSNEHVKERDAENKRITRHSTKAAQQAADVDGIFKATKKKRANKKQRYQESKYLREHGAELLRGGREEVDGDCCHNCRRKNFSSNPRYALEFEVVSNTEI